jgi:hypothetical protein
VESQLSETPKVGDLLVVQSLSPLVLEPVDALQIAMLNTDMVLLVDTTAPSATTTVTLPLAGSVNVYMPEKLKVHQRPVSPWLVWHRSLC